MTTKTFMETVSYINNKLMNEITNDNTLWFVKLHSHRLIRIDLGNDYEVEIKFKQNEKFKSLKLLHFTNSNVTNNASLSTEEQDLIDALVEFFEYKTIIYKAKSKTKESKIIAGFPGVGKSYLQNNDDFTHNVIDTDAIEFFWEDQSKGIRHKNFPNNYFNYIMSKVGRYEYIMTTSHKELRDLMLDSNVDFTMVYPDVSLKEDYIDRYFNRGSANDFIISMDKRWEQFINEIELDDRLDKYKLDNNDLNLVDYINTLKDGK